MSESDSDYIDPNDSNQEQDMDKNISTSILCTDEEESGDETYVIQSPSGSEEEDAVNKMKGMTEEQVRELIHKMNIEKNSSSEEEVVEEKEIKDSNVEEKNVAKNKNKKVANALPKKVTKANAQKNEAVYLEENEDETTMTNEMSSELDIKSNKSKKGKTENIDKDNAAATSNVKPNKPIKVAKGKQNSNKENHTENQPDLEFNKKENENVSVDTKNSPENNVKGTKNSKKTKPAKKQNSKENNETKGKPDKSVKKGINEPDVVVQQSKVQETTASIDNTETTSTRTTRARAKNALSVIQENNDSVEKQTAINNTNEEPAKGRKKKNVKKGEEQTNENMAPESDVIKDVEQKSKKKQNSAKENVSEKQNNPTSVPKNKQTKSKAEVLQEKKENKPQVVTKRAARKK